jgi:lipid-binding SYLF domain-containing protein
VTPRKRPKMTLAIPFIDAILEKDFKAPFNQRHTAHQIWGRVQIEMPACDIGESTVQPVTAVQSEPQDKESISVENAGHVMEQISSAPDAIPQGVLDQANCVVIVRSVQNFTAGKAGSYGLGVITCRGGMGFYGPWGAPAMVALEGSSAESQLGGTPTDFVPLLMSTHAADQFLKGKLKLGGDATFAAGPVSSASSKETVPLCEPTFFAIRAYDDSATPCKGNKQP